MNITLATINLEVADVARSKAFYTNVLRMRDNSQRSHPPTFAYLESSTCAVTLTTPPGGRAVAAGQSMEIGYETDDLPAFRDHLTAMGVSDVTPQSMGWGDAVELHDPDGHRVIVYAFRRR